MAGMNTLQMIKVIPTIDGRNYVEWTRSFNEILQITWPFELFNDRGGRGNDDSVPEEFIKTSPSGIGVHDPLHGRQACPELKSFHQGVGRICSR